VKKANIKIGKVVMVRRKSRVDRWEEHEVVDSDGVQYKLRNVETGVETWRDGRALREVG